MEHTDVTSIKWHPAGVSKCHDKCWAVETRTGKLLARVVVLAIGPGTPSPLALCSPQEWEGMCHSSQIPSRGLLPDHVRTKMSQKKDTCAIVVGGGLTSAQIADMCVRKGYAKVYMLMRSRLKVKHFDLELDWVAKYRNLQLAYFWGTTDPETRSEIIKTARNGGSITPAYVKLLDNHRAQGKLSYFTQTTIASKTWNTETKCWQVVTEPPIEDLPAVDFIYYATGAVPDFQNLPLLKSLQEDFPIHFHDGLPCITEDLQWNRDIPLFFTGRSAALQLGPGAANLEGARMGAERIAPRIQELLEEFKEGQYRSNDPSDEDFMNDMREKYKLGATHLNMYSALAV